MPSQGDATLVATILLALIIVGAGLYLYSYNLHKMEPQLDALSPVKCGEYTYLVQPTRFAGLYNVTVYWYYSNGSVVTTDLGKRIAYVQLADCKRGLFLPYGYNQVINISVYPGSYPLLIPKEYLDVMDNASSYSGAGALWLGLGISGYNGKDPAFGVYDTYLYLKYDRATGMLLEGVNKWVKPEGTSLPDYMPEKRIYEEKLVDAALVSENLETTSYKDTVNYMLIASYAAGVVVAGGIIGILYTLSTRI